MTDLSDKSEPGKPADLWHEDGTGKEQLDGTETTCDSSFNRGYDKGFLAGMNEGVPPVRLPRWDQDKTVLRFGFLEGRCGNCGEPYREVSPPSLSLGAPLGPLGLGDPK